MFLKVKDRIRVRKRDMIFRGWRRERGIMNQRLLGTRKSKTLPTSQERNISLHTLDLYIYVPECIYFPFVFRSWQKTSPWSPSSFYWVFQVLFQTPWSLSRSLPVEWRHCDTVLVVSFYLGFVSQILLPLLEPWNDVPAGQPINQASVSSSITLR